jgi:nucleotide-binding universal stress UspA family protein
LFPELKKEVIYMNSVRKILVPINFSEESANGLKYAVSLAEKTQAEVVVLHVTQKKEAESFLDLLALMEGAPMLNPPPAIPVDRLLREKALDLYRFIEKAVKNPGRLTIRRKIALGDIAKKIARVAREENIDLVVLGIRQKSLTRGKLLKMLSRFPCPVLLKTPIGEPWPHMA